MSSCEVCGKEDLLGYEMVNMCKQCAASTGGTQPTDVQQLKAEIAALANFLGGLSEICEPKKLVDGIVEKLRQLSAV